MQMSFTFGQNRCKEALGKGSCGGVPHLLALAKADTVSKCEKK